MRTEEEEIVEHQIHNTSNSSIPTDEINSLAYFVVWKEISDERAVERCMHTTTFNHYGKVASTTSQKK